MTSSDTSALVSARLCHDLISPIGAIGNGLELLEMSAGQSSPELALVADSLDNALGKLRFFRIAFGPADPEATISGHEITAITDTMYQGRFTVAWTINASPLPRPRARTIFLAILCLEKSLPLGGRLEVIVDPADTALRVDGSRVAAPEELWAIITDNTESDAIRSDSVQFELLRKDLSRSAQSIQVCFTETRAEIALRASSARAA